MPRATTVPAAVMNGFCGSLTDGSNASAYSSSSVFSLGFALFKDPHPPPFPAHASRRYP